MGAAPSTYPRTCALNLCDTAVAALVAHAPDAAAALGALCDAACADGGFAGVDRLVAGSYTCDRAFLALGRPFWRAVASFARAFDLRVTLALPVFGPRTADAGWTAVDELLGDAALAGVLDEVCVNDYGAAHRMAGRCGPGGWALVWGRLFCRAPRDPRYRRFDERPQAFPLDADAFDALRAQFPVALVEADPIAPQLDLAPLAGRVPVALHLPHCLITTGRICEAASERVPVEAKFRAGAPCACECAAHADLYEVRDEDGGPVWLTKLGRGVWFENPGCRAVGGDVARVIWTPADFGCPIGGAPWASC